MTGSEITDIVYALLWAPLWAFVYAAVLRLTGQPPWRFFWPSWANAAFWTIAGYLPWWRDRQDWLWPLLIGCAHLALALLMWWRRRRKRRKVAAMLGAKSRALRDALVRKVRELTPRPVLRPVPVPA